MAIQPQATRSLRRVKVRTPGNKLVTHYLKRKPSIAKCGNCSKELKGIPRGVNSEIRNLTRSQRTVARPYGGNLCSKCSQEEILKKFKNITESPLDIGQICVKFLGKEAGKICVVVDKIDDNFVLIDGQVKRRRCNILHLKTLDKKIEISSNENTENIKKEITKLGYEIKEKLVKENNKKDSEVILQKESKKSSKEKHPEVASKNGSNGKRNTKKVR